MYGYDLFESNAEPYIRPLRIEADAESNRFLRDDGAWDDNAASLAFVRDLEAGHAHAVKIAKKLTQRAEDQTAGLIEVLVDFAKGLPTHPEAETDGATDAEYREYDETLNVHLEGLRDDVLNYLENTGRIAPRRS